MEKEAQGINPDDEPYPISTNNARSDGVSENSPTLIIPPTYRLSLASALVQCTSLDMDTAFKIFKLDTCCNREVHAPTIKKI